MTKLATCTRAFCAMSARTSISSETFRGPLIPTALTMEAAGMSPICGSTGPSTALASITISSAASAIRVPPLIA